jgi:sec-independent protein translocase protein TatB
MFDIGSSELLLIVIVAIVVIGPKDLPRALYKLGQVIGKARGMARHFRGGVDAMIREAELEELQKQWAKENERIMAASQLPELGGTMTPLVDETVGQLPPPEADVPVADAALEEAIPLPDASSHTDTPKGSSAS